MTVAATTPVNQYLGNGGSNSFSFTFPVFNPSQLTVSVNGASLSQALVLGVDYSVSGLNAAGNPASTGNIVLINAGQSWLSGGNLAVGYTITIIRSVPYSQTTSIRNQGDFYRASLEDALDILEMQIQQLSVMQNNPIYTDIVTGFTYQIVFANGVLSAQRLT